MLSVNNRSRIIAVLIATVMLLCSCDSSDSQKISTSKSDSITDVTGEKLNDEQLNTVSEYPVNINDTVIASSPKRVICLSSSLTEIIYELGCGDRLIGRGTYCEYPEEAASLKDYGKPASPDLTAVKEAAPDLLLTATAVPSKDITALSDLGITVLYIQSPHSIEEYGRIYSALAMVFEGIFEGEKTGESTFKAVKSKLTSSDISLGSFLYVTEGISIAGGDTFESSILSLFGENAAKDLSGYVLGKELPENIDPDVIILNSDVSKSSVLSDSNLSALRAVSDGNIITVNNYYFESPSGRITGLIDELSGAKEKQDAT